MRQLTFVEPGKLEWWEVPTAALQGDGEAVVPPVSSAATEAAYYG